MKYPCLHCGDSLTKITGYTLKWGGVQSEDHELYLCESCGSEYSILTRIRQSKFCNEQHCTRRITCR